MRIAVEQHVVIPSHKVCLQRAVKDHGIANEEQESGQDNPTMTAHKLAVDAAHGNGQFL
jgi:hypothetical protein